MKEAVVRYSTERMLERFERCYVPEPNSGCWLWTAADNGNGYSIIAYARGLNGYAHRFAYEHFVGPIPDGMEIDHKCMVRCCVNPDHLEAVTHRVNLLRSPRTFVGRHARATHCPKGHPYLAENTYASPKNGRSCIACRRESDKKRGKFRGIRKRNKQ